MKKSIIGTISSLMGAAVGAGITSRIIGKAAEKDRNMSEKHLALFLMMNRWVKVKQEGKNLASYFEKNDYKTIAIYGMSYAGETLLEELKDSQIKIKYQIDRNANHLYADVVTLEECSDVVDAVVVTPIFFFDEIEEQLSDKFSCPILSLDDILCEM